MSIVSDASSNQARNDNLETKAPTQKPSSKWVKVEQQLLKGLKVCQKIQQQGSNRDQSRIVRVLVPVVKGPSAMVAVKRVIQLETTKPRPEGEIIETRFNAIIVKGGGICIMSA